MKQRKTEHPILMCGEMVRAILAGTKTETRRMAGLNELNKKHDYCFVFKDECGDYYEIAENRKPIKIKHPYGVDGDTLWVRETFAFACGDGPGGYPVDWVVYRADGYENALDEVSSGKWKPSLFMPKNASRITLTVKSVTLERLHEITDEGARAEGVSGRAEYEKLWKQLNGEESWNLNPWVWVVKFDVREVRK